jgi:hypothetical protein
MNASNATNRTDKGMPTFPVDRDSSWLDVGLYPLDIGANFRDPAVAEDQRFGKLYNVRSVRVPEGLYTARLLAETLTTALASAFGDFFSECDVRYKERQKAKGTLGVCAKWSPEEGPMAVADYGGGAIRVRVDERDKQFVFEYNATEVSPCVCRVFACVRCWDLFIYIGNLMHIYVYIYIYIYIYIYKHTHTRNFQVSPNNCLSVLILHLHTHTHTRAGIQWPVH